MHHFRNIPTRTYFALLISGCILLILGAFTPHKSFKKNWPDVVVSIAHKATGKLIDLPELIANKADLYDSLHLESFGLDRKVFELALKGMSKLMESNQIHANILSIADFSKPSTMKRLFVIDLDNAALLFNTWVAHGRNSGLENAQNFSNKPSSNKSSLGFYVTGEPYQGSNGYSLKLFGMEQGFNSNAFKRAIVIHGADYVNPNLIEKQGFIGRSQGCPAVLPELTRPLINTIKEGSCLFVYHPNNTYLHKSSLLH